MVTGYGIYHTSGNSMTQKPKKSLESVFAISGCARNRKNTSIKSGVSHEIRYDYK
jgi:hypothetical protein